MPAVAPHAPARRPPAESSAAPPKPRETPSPAVPGAAGRLLSLRAPGSAPVLRRKCACGGDAGPDGECEECRQKRLQMKPAAAGGASPGAAPASVHRALGGPGRPLDAGTRAFMEPRFGRGFGDVRVHADGEAAASAQEVGALAYTVGRRVVFGAGRYQPDTPAGRRLLAHELAHVVQQEGGGAAPDGGDAPLQRAVEVGPAADPLEDEADRAADAVMSAGDGGSAAGALRGSPRAAGTLQRSLGVAAPGSAPAAAPAGNTNATIVADYIATLCPSFHVVGGDVVPKSKDFCSAGVAASGFPVACKCLCDLHNATTGTPPADQRWLIRVADDEWPHTDDAVPEVTVHSPFSGVQFGAWSGKTPREHKIELPNWLVLGHELCGHAALMVRGVHPTGPAARHGGRPSHDPTVTVENAIAAEHGVAATELRGLFRNRHHGESWGRVTVQDFASGSASIPAAELPKLDTAEQFIVATGGILMDVIGHADSTGSATQNTSISRLRAQAVRDNLLARPAITGAGVTRANFKTIRGDADKACTAPGSQPSCRKAELFMFVNEGAAESHR